MYSAICKLADWPGQFANWPDWQIGRDIFIGQVHEKDRLTDRQTDRKSYLEVELRELNDLERDEVVMATGCSLLSASAVVVTAALVVGES